MKFHFISSNTSEAISAKEKYINSSKRDIRVTLFFNYKINDNWKISPGI